MKSFYPFLLTAVLTFLQFISHAQQTNSISSQVVKSKVIFLGETEPLSEISTSANSINIGDKKIRTKEYRRARVPNFEYNVPMPINNPDALPKNGDPLVSPPSFTSVTGIEVIPDLIIEGMGEEELNFVSVPDDNGDTSPEHYIQMANTYDGAFYQIFDKEGNSVFGPESCQSFWTPFNANGLGDPVVTWDQEAGRWMMTELSFDFTSMLIAISSTDDPMGSWYVYEFQSPFGLPDYPKYGVWPDGYYITTNEYITGGPLDNSIPVYILERDKMLDGDTDVDLQIVGVPKFLAASSYEFVFQVASPINWEGSNLPPVGSPYSVVRIYDDAWDGESDRYELWDISVDWDDENNTTVTGPTQMPAAPFDSNLCDGDIFNCIDESDGTLVSALQQVIMNRVTYRNFGTYEAIVMCFSVNVDQGDKRAGVRWAELRRVGNADWELYQEGTVSNEVNHLFMPTIGMDATGSIALGYSEMGPDKFLSLSFTGRRASDALGEMTVEPYEIAEGQSNHDQNRWGDYASMTVDPVDGRTFWFSSQYTKEDFIWGTKIATFQIRRDTNDVGPSGLNSPVTSAYLTNNETVEAVYKNFGYDPQVDFEVGYIFENGVAEIKMITDTLQPDSSVTVVFDNPVDMDVIQDYDFSLFTSLEGDENILNDTLRLIVKKLTRWDAAVDDIAGIGEGVYCDSSLVTDVIIENVGQEPLTSVNIHWQLNSGPLNTEIWNGNLLAGESTPVTIDFGLLQEGTNNLLTYTTDPSGMMDEDLLNDTLNRDFLATIDGRTITLAFTTDFVPSENTWELLDMNGVVLYEGGPYSQTLTEFIHDWCLPLGCYTFKLYDVFGNGMFSGGYTITDDDGTELASTINLNFGFEESNDFCVEFQCMLSSELTPSPETSPGAGDGAIIVTTFNGTAPFEYSLNGNTPQSTPIISGLTAGNYTVITSDTNGCTSVVEVDVPVCNITSSISFTPESSAGAEDGSITINVGSGNPPYQYSIDGGMTYFSNSIFENLPPGSYTVIVQDAFGCEESVDVEISTISDVVETSTGAAITVYPNPSEFGYVVIDVHGLTGADFVYYDVMDAAGKVVQRARIAPVNDYHTGRFTIANFPDGVYFIRFHHKALDQAARVVKGK